LKAGGWCGQCRYNFIPKNNMYSENIYNKCKEVIESKGGKIISEKFINSKTPIEFYCDNNHKNKHKAHNIIKKGYWCKTCYFSNIKTKSFNKYKKLIEDYGGKCITTFDNYKGAAHKIEWQCVKGHNQKTNPPGFIESKNHCKICFKKVKLTLEQLQEIAKKRGGKCLSDKYVNNTIKLLWECVNGHQWTARSFDVKNKKSWCPTCKVHIKEQICRKIFEKMFNKKFPNTRPKWLKGSKGYPLELDGYNKALKLSWEYNGQQHYMSIHGSDYKAQQKRDKLKVKICKKKGINLIVIPYTIKLANFQEFIINKCKELDIIMPNDEIINIDDLEIDYKNRLEELRKIIEKKGGTLLSKSYIGANEKIKVQCKKGHIWNPKVSSIKNNHWCRKCLYNQD